MIQNWGLYALLEHRKSEDAQLLGIWCWWFGERLAFAQKSLQARWCCWVWPTEGFSGGLCPVSTLSMFAITVDELIAGETANDEARTSSAVVFKSSGNRLWVCQFLICQFVTIRQCGEKRGHFWCDTVERSKFPACLYRSCVVSVKIFFVCTLQYCPNVKNSRVS